MRYYPDAEAVTHPGAVEDAKQVEQWVKCLVNNQEYEAAHLVLDLFEPTNWTDETDQIEWLHAAAQTLRAIGGVYMETEGRDKVIAVIPHHAATGPTRLERYQRVFEILGFEQEGDPVTAHGQTFNYQRTRFSSPELEDMIGSIQLRIDASSEMSSLWAERPFSE